jgi:hypothetical protein
VPVSTSAALSRGREVHRWLAEWWGGTLRTLPEDPVARACCVAYGALYERPHLTEIDVEMPWSATIAGVPCAGTVDAIGLAPNGQNFVVEHKTTSEDIQPGSVYWRRIVTTDPQVSMYRAAFPGAIVLYDVIRKPNIRQKKDESNDRFFARCLETMGESPRRYFQRANVVRMQSEDASFESDIVQVDRLRRRTEQPRNPDACFAYGSRCGYWSVCWEDADLQGAEFRDQDDDR